MSEDEQQGPKRHIADSSEEEEGLDQYEKDDFIVDEIEEEESEEKEENKEERRNKRKKTTKKRKRREAVDMDLVIENLGITSNVNEERRPGKYRRLKKTTTSNTSPEREGIYNRYDPLVASPTFDQDSPIENEYDYERNSSYPTEGTNGGYEEEEDDLFGGDFSEYMQQDTGSELTNTSDSAQKYASMKSVYEPSDIAASFMTERDVKIKSTDLPERYQDINQEEPPTEIELQEEANWIAYQLPQTRDRASDELVIETLFTILRSIRIDMHEIPYIATYQKNLYQIYFQKHELWDIFHFDEKWRNYAIQRHHMEKLIDESKNEWSILDPDYAALLTQSVNEEQLQDISNNLQLYHYDLMVGRDQGEFRRPERRDFYFDCIRSGLRPLADKFGLSAKHFGLNLKSNYMEYFVDDPTELPEDVALSFITENFSTCEMVLTACRQILAHEIAHDYHVRQWIRDRFLQDCIISTEPTHLGSTEMDATHPLRCVKRLGEKPLSLIKREGQMAFLVKANDEKLISITLSLQDRVADDLGREMADLYLSTSGTASAALWNNERRNIISTALKSKLLPSLSREILHKETLAAREQVSIECARTFRNQARFGPFGGKSRVVVSLVWGADGAKEPVVATAIDRKGILLRDLRLEHMSHIPIRPQRNIESNEEVPEKPDIIHRRQQKQQSLDELRDFILECRPAVIVVAANCMHAKDLKEDVDQIILKMRDEYQSVSAVVWASSSVPEICATDAAYKEEFPNHSSLHRCSIALGRMVQDPLPQYALLFNDKCDITSLPFHPLQSIVQKKMLMSHLEHVLIDYVNLVGLDILRVVEAPYSHFLPCLPFIAGLGRRKADKLRMKVPSLTKDSALTRDLLASLEGPIVSKNMIGFLRITPEYSTGEYSTKSEFLDSTRIHLQHYSVARTIMAAILLEATGQVESEEEVEMAFTSLEQSEIVDAIENITQTQDRELSRIPEWLYEDIVKELVVRYKEVREAYREMSVEELFTSLTGETDDTLRVGHLITGTVYRITSDEVWVRLESGLTGKIEKSNISDQHVDFIRDRVDYRQALYCCVQRIDKETMEVHLSSKSSDLSGNRMGEIHDSYLLPDPPVLRNRPSSGSQTPSSLRKRPKVKERMITHSLFKNVTFLEAEEELEHAESGEMIFRPSSKGTDHLTLTFKFHNEFVHVDIEERDKPSKNPLVLGRKLLIRGDIYHDFDHIEAHFLGPIVMFTQKMAKFHRFSSQSEQVITDDLWETKHRDPGSIPYRIGVSSEYPGKYVLYYIPNKSVRKEYISVQPAGFRFRKEIFTSPSALVAYFKRNWNIGSKGTRHASSHRSQAARIPVSMDVPVSSSPMGRPPPHTHPSRLKQQEQYGAYNPSGVSSQDYSRSRDSYAAPSSSSSESWQTNAAPSNNTSPWTSNRNQ